MLQLFRLESTLQSFDDDNRKTNIKVMLFADATGVWPPLLLLYISLKHRRGLRISRTYAEV